MSRTNKDKPSRLLWKKSDSNPKVKKTRNDNWNWLGETPSWWTRLFMTSKQRALVRNWEQSTKRIDISRLEEAIEPKETKKPHIYYW